MSRQSTGRPCRISHRKINTVCSISLLDFSMCSYCSYTGMKPLLWLKQLRYSGSAIGLLLLFFRFKKQERTQHFLLLFRGLGRFWTDFQLSKLGQVESNFPPFYLSYELHWFCSIHLYFHKWDFLSKEREYEIKMKYMKCNTFLPPF